MKKIIHKLFYILIPVLIIFFIVKLTVSATNHSVIVYNSSNGFLELNGQKIEKLHTDIPTGLITVDLVTDKNGGMYLTTLNSGIYFSSKINQWKNITPQIFRRRTALENKLEFRKISSLDANGSELIAATKHDVFLSVDKGNTWKKISLKGIERSDWRYYTAVSFYKNDLLVGTSTNGIFYKTQKFRDISKGLPEEPTYENNFFYESISQIAVNGNRIYAGFYFGKGLYMSSDSGKSWKDLKLPLSDKNLSAVHSIKFHDSTIYVSTSEGIFFKEMQDEKWKKHPVSDKIKDLFTDPQNLIASVKLEGVEITIKNDVSSERYLIKDTQAADKKAIYTSVWTLNKKSRYLLEIMKKTGINSIVIDLKDDSGKFFISTSNKTANEISAVNTKIDIKKYIKFFHDNGIHIIARMVVFKDKTLYEAYGNKYAIWDSKTNRPWKGSVSHEYWCDPFSSFVQEYNIDLAKEAEKAGFDEIQFDYIRFPTDGPIYRCQFRHSAEKDAYKSEALADFLEKAQKEIKIPVSTDIYGFNAWYNFGNIMGQDIEVFSQYVDALSPMMYPSHYGNRFYSVFPQTERPFRIVYHNSIRAHYLSGNRVHIRPYIQAFNLLSPTWGPGYINSQIKAVKNSGTDGYIFWNASGEYNMLIKAAQAK